MGKHETSEHDQMKTSQWSEKPLIIAHQPKDSCPPRARALHDPASGKPGRSRAGALPSIWATLSLCWRWEAEESMLCLRRPFWKQSAADGKTRLLAHAGCAQGRASIGASIKEA